MTVTKYAPRPKPFITIRELGYSSSEFPTNTSRLFAVLIGINYAAAIDRQSEFRPLRGAVADTLNFNRYLQGNLGVPSDQIVVLTEKNATRFAIMEALTSLRMDDRIRKGDPILIYFAGLGVQMQMGSTNEPKMGAIIPYDGISNSDNNYAQRFIPDFVLEVQLARIASHKGNNITVIFDCPYSAPGSTRSGFDFGYRARLVDVPSQEDEITVDEARFLRTSQSSTSHILLTACSPRQIPKERNGHGLFTDALLELLCQIPSNKLRYSEIVSHPNLLGKLEEQDPRCEGIYRHRFLFNAPKIFRPFFVQYNETANNGKGRFYVHTGVSHNITLDSKIAIYRENDITLTERLGVLHVDKLHPFFITAKLATGTPYSYISDQQPIIAITNEEPEEKTYLSIHIPPNDDVLRAYRDIEKTFKWMPSKYNLGGIRVIDDNQGSAEITLMASDKTSINMTIQTVTHHKFNRVINIISPWVLSGMAHFYRELNLLPDTIEDFKPSTGSPILCHGNIEVEFFQLREVSTVAESTGFLDEKLEPYGKNLYLNGKVDLIVADDYGYSIPYGLKLGNKSTQDFHVNLFHFTNSDLSISPCIQPNTGPDGNRGTRIHLPSRGNLNVGYGPEGHPPICFEIADEYDVDVGFLKIYLSTQPVNLDLLVQPSPFDRRSSARDYIPTPKVNPWIEIVIPIIQTLK